MYANRLSTLLATYFLLLGYHEIHAGVTLLVEGPGSPKNSSGLLSKVKEATQAENERVTEKLLLTQDKQVRDAWRTERGDLVELQYLNMYSSPKDEPSIPRSDIPAANGEEIHEKSTSGPTTVNSGANLIVSDDDAYYGGRSSHRMRRTFWPFTSLFGYDYPPPFPPPNYGLMGPGMFGSGMPPFGSGLGLGFPGPFGPPPPLGLGFTLGF